MRSRETVRRWAHPVIVAVGVSAARMLAARGTVAAMSGLATRNAVALRTLADARVVPASRGRPGCWRLLPVPRACRMLCSAQPPGWDGGLSQTELMETDECVLVDAKDRIIGGASKAAAHRRMRSSGDVRDAFRLHRAFSVFLFDDKDRLLLQQRAGSKITFPLVWTNTCCSHPLHGQRPCEVDGPSDVNSGQVWGVKHAAIRKLGHELGIARNQLPAEAFKFLTRLHYCAGDDSEPDPHQWGEHELDYLLLVRVSQVELRPNPEEVEAVRWVSPSELQIMMDPSSGYKWSPWFRIIAEQLLPSWWSDLDSALNTDAYVDGKIHAL